MLGKLSQLLESKLFIDFNEQVLSIIHQDSIVFEHPFKKGIKTYCRFSYGKGVRVLFFSDEQFLNRWCLVQSGFFFNGLICEDITYKSATWLPDWSLKRGKDLIDEAESKFDCYSTVRQYGGLLVKHPRPYHYIYEQLMSVSIIYNSRHKFTNVISYNFEVSLSFFDLRDVIPEAVPISSEHEDFYYLSPALSVRSDTSDFKFQDIESFTFNSLVSKYTNSEMTVTLKEKYDFIIWLGITGQKRGWVEQVEGYRLIIEKLKNHYGKVLVLVDGWTSFYSGKIKKISDDAVFNELSEGVSENITFLSMIGMPYSMKIDLCNVSNYFVCNGGSGSLIPVKFSKTNGYIHSNKSLYMFGRTGDNNRIIYPRLTDIDELPSDEVQNTSYSIDPNIIMVDIISHINKSK